MGLTLLPICRKLCHFVGENWNQSGKPCSLAASRAVMTRLCVGWIGLTAWNLKLRFAN